MKNHLAILTTLFLSLFNTSFSSFASNNLIKSINNSTNVVYGRVTSQNSFKNDNGYVVTDNTIETLCSFKGGFKNPIIVRTLGGEIDGEIHTNYHSAKYILGGEYIFFLTEIDKVLYPISEDGTIVFPNKLGMPYAMGLGKSFYSPEELLLKLSHIGVSPCMQLPANTNRRVLKSSKNFPADSLKKILAANKIKFDQRTGQAKKKKTKTGARLASTISYNLEFDNYIYTFENNKDYVEFDILISSTTPAYYISTAIQLSYNNATFAENSWAKGDITITPGADFNNPSNYELIGDDKEPNVIGLNLAGYYDRDLIGLTSVSSTPKVLLHFKMYVTETFFPAELVSEISFLTPDFNFGEYSSTPNVAAFESSFVDGVNHIGSLYDKIVCFPVVESMTPDVITSGTNSILTLKGYNFGKSRGSNNDANVLFRDADEGGGDFLEGLDDVDIKSWTDNEIKVVVPSHFITERVSGIRGVAGSGTFKVVNYGKIWMSLTKKPLNVKYSITNIISSYGVRDIAHRIADDTEGKRTFKLTQSIVDDPKLLNAIVLAIKDWNCNVGIGIDLEKDGENYAIANDNSLENIFRITPLTETPNTVALASNTSSVCLKNGVVEYANKYSVITINSDLKSRFWYRDDMGPIAPNQLDVTEVITHEIGHAIGLSHVSNLDHNTTQSDFIMFAASVPLVSVNSSPYTKEGADAILSIDRAHLFNPECKYEAIGIDFQRCAVGIEDALLEQQSTIRPNVITNDLIYLDEKVISLLMKIRAISNTGKVFEVEYISGQQHFNLNDVPSGNYIIELICDKYIYRNKLIKL